MRSELFFFTLVGAIAFAVDVGILYIVKSAFGLYWGRVISFICAVFITWLLNRKLTFKERFSGLSLFSEFARYLTVMISGGMVNYLIYASLVVTLKGVANEPIWGVAAGSCAGLLVNFILARSFVFRVQK